MLRLLWFPEVSQEPLHIPLLMTNSKKPMAHCLKKEATCSICLKILNPLYIAHTYLACLIYCVANVKYAITCLFCRKLNEGMTFEERQFKVSSALIKQHDSLLDRKSHIKRDEHASSPEDLKVGCSFCQFPSCPLWWPKECPVYKNPSNPSIRFPEVYLPKVCPKCSLIFSWLTLLKGRIWNGNSMISGDIQGFSDQKEQDTFFRL